MTTFRSTDLPKAQRSTVSRRDLARAMLNKVPEVTLYFWIIKVLCTTVGETAADFLNDNLGLGLTNTTLVMAAVLVVALVFQFTAAPLRAGDLLARRRPDQRRRHADHRQPDGQLRRLAGDDDRRLLRSSLAAVFAAWYASERTLSIHTIVTTKREAFYWLAVLFTFALGTAAGDLTAERLAVGYWKSALLFGGLIAVVYFLHLKLGAERDPRLLDRLHPDAAARRLDRRLPLAAARRRRARPRHDRDERDLPAHDPRRRRLPDPHEGRPDRRRRRPSCGANVQATGSLVLVVTNKVAATPALVEAVRERAAAGPADVLHARAEPRPPRLRPRERRHPRGREDARRGAAGARTGCRGPDRAAASRRAPTPTTTSWPSWLRASTPRSSSRRRQATCRTGSTSTFPSGSPISAIRWSPSLRRISATEARIATAIRLVSPGTGRPDDSAATTAKRAAVDEQRRQAEEPVRDHASGRRTLKRPPASFALRDDLAAGAAARRRASASPRPAPRGAPEAATPRTPGSKMASVSSAARPAPSSATSTTAVVPLTRELDRDSRPAVAHGVVEQRMNDPLEQVGLDRHPDRAVGQSEPDLDVPSLRPPRAPPATAASTPSRASLVVRLEPASCRAAGDERLDRACHLLRVAVNGLEARRGSPRSFALGGARARSRPRSSRAASGARARARR